MKSCCKEGSENKEPVKKRGFSTWLKRLGVAGFLFFLVKGLIWVAVLYGGLRITGCGN